MDDSHLRALPPTLFRLRNLRVPQAAGVAFDSDASSEETGYDSIPEAVEAISTKDVSLSNNETLEKDSREIASSASTQRSLVSRLSSQSLVLFVILAIAITGIVIGNRGGEQVADTDSLLEESRVADFDDVDVDLGTASDELILAKDDAGPGSPSTTRHADLFSSTNSEYLDSNAFVQTETANAAASGSAPSNVHAEIRNSGGAPVNSLVSEAVPTSGSQDPAMTDLVQQKNYNPAQVNLGTPTSLASSGGNVIGSPAVSSEKAQVTNMVAATGKVPTSNTSSGYVQTQTPEGVNDWLRYLPSVNMEMEQPATLAVSDTPQNPIAIYQQYLDSTPPGNTQATAPVGYLQDDYHANTVGTEAQLPVSTSSTQRR